MPQCLLLAYFAPYSEAGKVREAREIREEQEARNKGGAREQAVPGGCF